MDVRSHSNFDTDVEFAGKVLHVFTLSKRWLRIQAFYFYSLFTVICPGLYISCVNRPIFTPVTIWEAYSLLRLEVKISRRRPRNVATYIL